MGHFHPQSLGVNGGRGSAMGVLTVGMGDTGVMDSVGNAWRDFKAGFDPASDGIRWMAFGAGALFLAYAMGAWRSK